MRDRPAESVVGLDQTGTASGAGQSRRDRGHRLSDLDVGAGRAVASRRRRGRRATNRSGGGVREPDDDIEAPIEGPTSTARLTMLRGRPAKENLRRWAAIPNGPADPGALAPRRPAGSGARTRTAVGRDDGPPAPMSVLAGYGRGPTHDGNLMMPSGCPHADVQTPAGDILLDALLNG